MNMHSCPQSRPGGTVPGAPSFSSRRAREGVLITGLACQWCDTLRPGARPTRVGPAYFRGQAGFTGRLRPSGA